VSHLAAASKSADGMCGCVWRGDSNSHTAQFLPIAKKLKSSSSHPTPPPAGVSVKGKERASIPMEVDDASFQDEEENSDGSSHSELDDEVSEDDSGDSLDTDAEIELAQQLSKSKQTLSAHRSAYCFLV
jgi:hypothetical protein